MTFPRESSPWADLWQGLLRMASVLLLAGLLAIPLAYIFFQTIFPSVSAPITDRYPSWLAILTFLAIGFLAGVLSRSVEAIAVQSILALVGGLVGAYLIFTSPAAAEEVTGEVLTQFFFVIVRMALPLALVALVALFAASFFGYFLYQYVETRVTRPTLYERWKDRGSP